MASEHFYFWLNSLKEFSQAEQCLSHVEDGDYSGAMSAIAEALRSYQKGIASLTVSSVCQKTLQYYSSSYFTNDRLLQMLRLSLESLAIKAFQIVDQLTHLTQMYIVRSTQRCLICRCLFVVFMRCYLINPSPQAASTPLSPLTFQCEFIKLRIDTLQALSQLICTCNSLKTSPPPAIATTVALTSGNELQRCGRISMQVRP